MDYSSFLSNIKDKFQDINEILERIMENKNRIDTIDVDLVNKQIAELYEFTTDLRKIIDLKKEGTLKQFINNETEKSLENIIVKEEVKTEEKPHEAELPVENQEEPESLIIDTEVEKEDQFEISTKTQTTDLEPEIPEQELSIEEEKEEELIENAEEPEIKEQFEMVEAPKIEEEPENVTEEEPIQNLIKEEKLEKDVAEIVEEQPEQVFEQGTKEEEKEEEKTEAAKEKEQVVEEKSAKTIITEELLEQSIAQNKNKAEKESSNNTLFPEKEEIEQPGLFEDPGLVKKEEPFEKIDLPIIEEDKMPPLFEIEETDDETKEQAGESTPKSIHEKFSKKEQSVNERLTVKPKTVAERVQKSPISDIKSAISLNMKLSFIKDLYKGDQKEYKRMIDFISKCKNYSEAKLFLQNEKDKRTYWNDKPELVDTLMDLIDRRFRV